MVFESITANTDRNNRNSQTHYIYLDCLVDLSILLQILSHVIVKKKKGKL